jgi:hypothetical protein
MKPSNYFDVEQGSADWLHLRCGCVTSSRVYDAIHKLKRGDYSKERENYMIEKLGEMLTGREADHYVSIPMDFGSENEPLARELYAMNTTLPVETCGYFRHPKIERAGASPDALVGADGLLEIKVPNTATHLDYLIHDYVPPEYTAQMFWQMACTGRDWCDFVSYDPRLPIEQGFYMRRLERSGAVIAEMEGEVERFLDELNALAAKLRVPLVAGSAPEPAQIPDWVESGAKQD